jgi:hypothetical protein
MKPEAGDLWVASTLVTDKRHRLGLSRVWLLGADLKLKLEIPTGDFGMISGLGRDPRTGIVTALDPTARRITRIAPDASVLPRIDLAPGRGLGSIVYLPDGGFLCGEHLCGDAPPFHGDGRLLHFDAEGRLLKLHRPKFHGGVSGFLGITHMALSAGGRILAYVSETGDTVFRYDVAEGRQLENLYRREDPPHMVFGLAAAPHDTLLLCCGGEVRRIDARGVVQRRFLMPEGRGWSFVTLSKDGQSFWCGDFFAGVLARVRLSDGEIIANAKLDVPYGVTSVIEV